MQKHELIDLVKKIAVENPDGNKSVACLIEKSGKILSFGVRKTINYNDSPFLDRTIHAEQMAIITCQFDLSGATLYTTLEPCACRPAGNGYDEEISCCDLIIKSGISKVIYIEKDDLIGRGGREYLTSKGIDCLIEN